MRARAYASSRHVHIFFFQAEDGIRDLYVTGVQTCALPISSATASSCGTLLPVRITNAGVTPSSSRPPTRSLATRSEERRVGKSVDLGCRRFVDKTTYSASHLV